MDPLITPMLVGMGVNALRTGIQAGKTKGLKSAYDTAEGAVNAIDPNQIAFLNRLRTQEQRFRAGSDPTSAFAAQGVQQQGAQAQNNMLRAGGPGAVGNILRAQQGVNQGMAQVGATAAAAGNQLLGMQGGVINLIAQRQYDLQRDRRNQAMARYEQNRQDVWNGISGLTATLPGLAFPGQTNMGVPKGMDATKVAPPMNSMKGQTPMVASGQYGGGFVGNQWAPSVQAGIGYQGMGTAPQQPANYGFTPQPQRPNFGFNY
jgi:hypothetical protein